MSSTETRKADPSALVAGTAYSPVAGTATLNMLAARLQHAGWSLLPLGLFVVGVLGYEKVTSGLASVPRQGAVVSEGRPLAPAAISLHAARTAGGASPTAMPSVAKAAVATASVALFEDNRSLIENARVVDRALQTGQQLITERRVTLENGPSSRTLLGFASAVPLPAGSYATIRGLPADARLTHGLALGNNMWLVDGGDLPLVAIEIRSRVARALELDIHVLTADNRQIVTERVAMAATAPGKSKPVVEPARGRASLDPAKFDPAKFDPVRPDLDKSVAVTSAWPTRTPPTLKLASDAQLVAGRGHLMKFELSSTAKVPDGAYLLLRGLPADSALSRGVHVGPDVWLLTIAEFAAFEVRLPARATGRFALDARLVTPTGDLITQTTVEIDASPISTVQASGAQVAAGTAAALTAARPQAIVPSASPRSVAPAVSAATVRSPLPTAKTKAQLAEDKVAGNPILARGRQLLVMGNIAIARPLLERAAAEGSGEGAAWLGASFDPAWLRRLGAIGIEGNSVTARRWYDEARRLGTNDVDKIVGNPPAGGSPIAAQAKRS